MGWRLALGTSSGIHAWHTRCYIQRLRATMLPLMEGIDTDQVFELNSSGVGL